MSVGSANPVITTTSQTSDQSATLNISWTNVGSSIFKPVINSPSSAINKLIFNFEGASSLQPGTSSGDSFTVSALTSDTGITLDATNVGLRIGDTGKGTIQIDFKKTTGKTFTLNAKTFAGNLVSNGGGKLVANFTGDVNGNITLTTEQSFGNVQSKTSAEVKFGGDYTGAINTNVGTNTFTFSKKNAQVNGTITASAFWDFYATAKNTFIFQKAATVASDITAESGEYGGVGTNNFKFQDTGVFTGNIVANSGENIITAANGISLKNFSASKGGSNSVTATAGNITFSEGITAIGGSNHITSSGTVTLASLVAKKSGYNYISAQDLTLKQDAIIGVGGGNHIVINNSAGDVTIAKQIRIQSDGGYSGKNTLALNAVNVTLGTDESSRIGLTINESSNGNPAYDSTASNLILLNGTTTSKAYITSMIANGNYGGRAPAKSYNILSFNHESGNTLAVGEISSRFATNVIGKNYLQADSNGFAILNQNNQLFDTNGAFITANFMNSANAATFASLTIDGAITANKGGTNFINITNDINIGKAITANNGNNYISAGTINATGTITAQTNGNNYIISSETVTIASLVANNAGYNYIKAKNLVLTQDAISGIAGGNKIALTNTGSDINISQNISIQSNGGYSGQNTLALNANNVTLGADNKRIALTINSSANGNPAWDSTASNLILLNGTQTSKAYITSMSANGNYGTGAPEKSYNILSFNQSSGNTLTVGDITSGFGANIIGKDYLQADSNGFAIIKKTTKTGSGSTQIDTNKSLFDENGAFIAANFMKADNAATFDSLTVDGAITANKGGTNFINTKNSISVGKDITANKGSNYISATSLNSQSINANNGKNMISLIGNGNSRIEEISISNASSLNVLAFSATSSATLSKSANTGVALTTTAGKNIISLDGNGSYKLSFSDISAKNSNATNYIAKGVATKNGADYTLAVAFEANWAKNTYKASGNISANKLIAVNSKNYINARDVTIDSIDSNGSSNNYIVADFLSLSSITARWNGANHIIVNAGGNAVFSGKITAGEKAGDKIGSGTNYIYLNDIASTFNNTSSLSAIKGTNFISLKNDTNNNLSLANISAIDGGTNYIGKTILNNSNGSLTVGATFNTDKADVDKLMSDTYAINGTFKVIGGVLASSSGMNAVSFVADNKTTSTIIGANTETGNAIAGGASIYLDVSASGISSGIDALESIHSASDLTTLSSKAVIAGNILGSSSTPTNIKIVGKANTQANLPYATNTNTNNAQIGILGNIATDSGATTNIVMQDSFLASSAVIKSGGNTQTILGGEKFGNITNNGGTTNIVTRFDVDPNFGDVAVYNVVNNSGTTNIVLQGDLDIGANVTYGSSGEINFIFANTNNINGDANGSNGNVSTDTFMTQMDDPTNADTSVKYASTDTSANRILGVTYGEGLKLTLTDKTIKVGDGTASFVNTYGHYFTDINEGKTSTFTTNRTQSQDTINIKGLVLGTISALANSTAKTYDVNIAENSAYVGSVALAQGSTVTLTMNQGSKLLTDNEVFYVKKLKIADNNAFNIDGLTLNTFAQNNTIIDLATMGSDLGNVEQGRERFRLFAVGSSTSSADTGLQGNNALFRVYVNDKANQDNATLAGKKANQTSGAENTGYIYADRIVIADIGDAKTPLTHNIQVIADGKTDLKSIRYTDGGTSVEGNIAVATVKNSDTNKPLVVFNAQDVVQGFDQVSTTLTTQETDQYGKTGSTGWTTYFVNDIRTKGATSERSKVSAGTLATNYDLYFANFNSLNKRMGELRDNANSQGVWARVFNGFQTNDMGLGTKTSYTTFQGGYDYAFGFEGANNYLGVAISYSMSSSEVQSTLQQAIDKQTIGFDNVKSSAVEVAVYNSYVQDEGWYNDSIFKFSYIMSDFNILGQNTTYNTNNMAFTFSDEVGYRFKLGDVKEWYIDPQAEVAFGYFDQSELKQTLGDAWLNTVADSVLTMRTRVGSSFGYDFKKFTENKPIKASVYVGLFYEYDYITGGDISLTTNLGGESTASSALGSDGRVVMNLGTNMTVKDNTRIYFDFEKSFGGDITTDYQVNFGVRYSFGESNGYTPAVAKAKEVAPLKVEEVKNTQENQTQESK